MKATFTVSRMAVAVSAALSSGASFALLPSAYNAATTKEVYISGASALQTSFNAALARICTPGTLDAYRAGSNNEAYFCSIAPGTFSDQGSNNKLIVYKSSEKGSGNGVIPLLFTGGLVAFIKMSDTASVTANCVTSGTASTVASVTISGDTLGVPSYTNRSCANSSAFVTTNVRPDAGVSDVEPPIFTTQNTAEAPAGPIEFTAPSHVIFGILVTENLYRALQAAQGLDSVTTATFTALGTALDTTVTGKAITVRDNEANMPSLTRDQIASLFTGTVRTWDKLKTSAGANLTGLPSDTNVYLARRVPSSGTQKASELFLFGGTDLGDDDGLGLSNGFPAACNTDALKMRRNFDFPNADQESDCTTPIPQVLDPDTLTSVNQTVFAGSGTGNVRNCLANHQTGGRWAVGIASTETSYSSTAAFRFIKIDGASPSLLNVVRNKYKNWVAPTVNKPPYFTDLAASTQGAVTKVFDSLGELTVIRAINNSFSQPWGQGAYLKIPGTGAATTAPASLTQADLSNTNPVNYLYKGQSGVENNCQLPTTFPGQAFPVN